MNDRQTEAPLHMSTETVTIQKLNAQGQLVWSYDEEVLERHPESIRLKGFFDKDEIDLGITVFRMGDRFEEYYYSDRWYNVYVVFEGDSDQLKGWYCNMSRPAEILPDTVRWQDLALDVWISPAGEVHIMDEDEFADLNLSPTEDTLCRLAQAHLEMMASNGTLPC